MTSQSSSSEKPACLISPHAASRFSSEFSEGRRRCSHSGADQALKLQEQLATPRSPRPYNPISSRAYNRKDYDYILSFPAHAVRHAGRMSSKSPEDNTSRISREEAACGVDTFSPTSKQKHVSLPEFGSWNSEASSTVEGEGYTDVFDRARDQKKGRIIPSQALRPHQSQSPTKGVAQPQIPSHATTHHGKIPSLSWSRCFLLSCRYH